MRDYISLAALFLLALILIIGGFGGSIGRLMACILVPSQVVENSTF